jgi:hypothetical protein
MHFERPAHEISFCWNLRPYRHIFHPEKSESETAEYFIFRQFELEYLDILVEFYCVLGSILEAYF